MKLLEFRIYEGINIYSYNPVIKLTLDLEDLAEVTTDQVEGFIESLLQAIPSLQEHYCSLGRPGGFVQRLKEGTYFGHVLEHIALELQHLAGSDVIYGKTRKTSEPGVYDVIYEHKSAEGGIQAGKEALKIIESLLKKETINIEKTINEIKESTLKYSLGPSTKAIAEEALKRDIPVMRLGEGSILQLGYGCNQRRVEATITDTTGCIGVDIAGDKILTKQLLSEAGIPVPVGGVARTEKEAIEIYKVINDTVVVKPYDGNQGKGVALNLVNIEQVKRAYAVAMNYSDRVIVEKFITGKHYRLIVVDNKVIAVSERLPASVMGDGVTSIEELIRKVNTDHLRGNGHEKPLTKITVDPVVLMVLAKQGYSLNSVPEEGIEVLLRENANLSTGGTAIDVTDQIHPDNRDLAVRATKIIGLDVAGIDLVAEDINIPLESYNGAIIEVNAAPGLRMHHYPVSGKARNIAKVIVDKLFPENTPARIPVVAITGTNGKTTTTRIIGHILEQAGKTIGMTTSDGVYIDGKLVMKGDTTGPLSAKTVLRDASVEIAILETARGGIIRAGLGFDCCEVGIITNISEDHLGIDGVETLEDLAYVKSIVAETVSQNGYTVLNADDSLVTSMAKRCRGSIIYFSKEPDNIVVRRHLGVGGRAVFIKRGIIVYAEGTRLTKVVSVKKVPCTLSGLAVHNVENVLAAIAGSLSLGLCIGQITNALSSFDLDLKKNPGRLNFFESAGIRILIDYGHNLAGYKHILTIAQKLKPNKLIGVIGVPGDRRDLSIIKIGEIAGQGCDEIIIKEDSNLRGRQPGEVAELLKKGVINGGLSLDNIQVSLKETNAVFKALERAREGDLVVVFYEKLEPVIDVVNTFNELSKVKLATEEAVEKKRGQIIG